MPETSAPPPWPERRHAALRAWRCGAALAFGAAEHPALALAPAPPPGSVDPQEASPARLSPALRHWVSNHTVRFAPEQDYGPFCFQQADGRVAGLAVDMLQAVQARTGLRVHTGAAAPLTDLLARARSREVDLLPALRPTPERARYLVFSRPYAAIPAVLVQAPSGSAGDLTDVSGQVVAVGQGYAVEAEVRRRHPAVRWLALPDDQQGLQAVARGQASAAVLDLASLGFLQKQQPALAGLKVVAAVGFEYQLSFAARSDWPELVAVLDLGIRALDAAQRRALVARWLPATPGLGEPASGPGTRHLAWGLLALSAAAGLGLAWRSRHRAGAAAGPTPTPAPGQDG